MFVGHYSVSFAGTAAVRTVPLWVLFLAVQIVDVGWAVLVLAGVEKVRIVPGFMEASPLDLYYMPYTHSLVGAAVFGLAMAAVYLLARGARAWAGGLVVALAVVSHWVLDLVVHTRDLTLVFDEEAKVGFGLWNSLAVTMAVETVLVLLGFALYMRTTRPGGRIGAISPWVLLLLLAGFFAFEKFGPMPQSIPEFATLALISYFGLAALAYWLDRTRVAR